MPSSHRHSQSPAKGLREFYELVVLLKIIGPCIGSRTQGSLQNAAIDERSYTPLRRFLDRLSWVCDYESGGETVSSIALEETTDGIVFWLAASYKTIRKAHDHLSKTLDTLKYVHTLCARDWYDLEQGLCQFFIDFSSQRVTYYSKLFDCLFEKCRGLFDQSDLQLAQDLSHMVGLEASPFELCVRADYFSNTESLRRLSQHVASNTSPSVWSLLRHYIGRLGSWHRAARVLMEYAGARPQLFANFRIEVQITPRPTQVPPADESTSLHSVLSRLFTAEERLGLGRGIEVLQNLRNFDLDSKFQKAYRDKNFKPRVHAEVWLLEHFWGKDLSFVDGDRYIGCSKPSCYCCESYIANRTDGTIERPSHGNVWPHWQSPLLQDSDKESLDTYLRLAMISKFKEDLKYHILNPTSKYDRPPDTSTGLAVSDTWQ